MRQIISTRRTHQTLLGLAALAAATSATRAAAAPRPSATSAVVEVVDRGPGNRRGTARFLLGLDADGRESRLDVASERATYKLVLRSQPARKGRDAGTARVELELRCTRRWATKGGRPSTTTAQLRASRVVARGQRVVFSEIQTGAHTTEVALTLR